MLTVSKLEYSLTRQTAGDKQTLLHKNLSR